MCRIYSPSRRLYGVPHALPQKVMPALTVRAAAIAHSNQQAAPTVRIKVSLRYMLSCLLLWLRHSSRQLLCPASRFVHSSFTALNTLHSLPNTHARFVWFICSLYFSPLQGEIKRGLAHNHKRHPLPTQAHSTPFRFVHFLFHSASCSPPAAPVVLACACRPGFGLSCFLPSRFVSPLSGEIKRGLKKSRQPLFVPFVPHFTHGSLPRSFVPQSRSLLTPYLLLASLFVEATPFALEARNTDRPAALLSHSLIVS